MLAVVMTTAMGMQGGGYARADEPNPTSSKEPTPRSECYVEYWDVNKPDMKTRISHTKSSSRDEAGKGEPLMLKRCCLCEYQMMFPFCPLYPWFGVESYPPDSFPPRMESRDLLRLEIGPRTVLNFSPELNRKPIRGPARIEEGLPLEALNAATLQCEDEDAPR
ncbi:hypothetical protein [Cystobacter ferrugineus]|uniref:Uncharacterized protein n=1 Tax=Cystobacter ferrugineus TaxID=83449 RepID=A0A1L9BIJ1_9BACT|nr:hypothetical protein [Cystobacter ferrugineus]OJH42059.1 hypothetical protein BON30_02210 [Cystobacter ferrugineus]